MNTKKLQKDMQVKCVFLFLFFIPFFVQTSNAQLISVKELISIQGMNFKESNTYLSNKGWKFSHKKDGVIGKYNRNSWAYEKDQKSGGAVAWMNVLSYPGCENRVVYQIQNAKNSDILLAQIAKQGMININNNTIENSVLNDYEGNGYVIRVIQSSVKDSTQKQYLFIVFTSEDFMYMTSGEEDPNDVLDQNDIF